MKYLVIGQSNSCLSMVFEIFACTHHQDSIAVDLLIYDENGEIDPNLIEDRDDVVDFSVDIVRVSNINIHGLQPIYDKIFLGGCKVHLKKQFLMKLYETSYTVADLENAIHPFSNIASTVQLGRGIYINPGVVIGPHSSIEDLVFINRNVSIGHHTTIQSLTTINPGANIAGRCNIGKGVTIGMGANIGTSVHIGDNTIIGAGALVLHDVPSNVVVYGVPAKIIRSVE